MKFFFAGVVFGIASLMVASPMDALAKETPAVRRDSTVEKAIADHEKALLEMKQNGGTMWQSEKWMKSPEYYASLSTPDLGEQCFAKPTFGFEMSIFNDSRFGLQRLRILHNGFAELFAREDMWKGILAAYDNMSLKIDPGNDTIVIHSTSINLDHMWELHNLPLFAKQVDGREAIFLAANMRTIKRYRWYLDNYEQDGPWSAGFFREPCSVARVALLLAEKVDVKGFKKVFPAIQEFTWPPEQDIENVETYLDLVIESLDGIITDAYSYSIN